MNIRFYSLVRLVMLLIISGTVLGGCALTKDIEASRNRDNLNTLKIGMPYNKVVEVMGKPWKKESFMSENKPHVVLYYVTQRIPDGTTTDEEMTPVVLENNHLIGWGRNFFSDLRIELK